ncbi:MULTISPECIES: polysaccharide deacetylase family protein [Bacteroides]|mgnify:CR=1 FL=1|uniref:polysaccharide deacetylase family protein n=1 Tax=Bacteroides TaxID=816 RepID=UPI001899F892|nr:polysaccharide deacetylase family protein [Bacteroides nordii]
MVRNNIHGSLVISLDYELMWGVRDLFTPEDYGQSNIKQVSEVISRLLQLFYKYDIHATFAVVGFIFCKDQRQAMEYSPVLKPSYDEQILSPYTNNYIKQIKEEHNELFFAPDSIAQLQANKNIEVGTHTFCHYYCWAKGQTTKQFDADLSQACKVAAERGLNLKSIVFPRNEVDEECLKVCAKHGITVYRGNAKKFFAHKTGNFSNIVQRICRLLNAYVKIGRHSVAKYSEIDIKFGCINIPATRMIRPYSLKLKILEGQRLRHVKAELEYAAKTNSLCHLWWHPHNFGTNVNENFDFLEEVLKHFAYCRNKYGMQSYTMAEMAEYLKSVK